MCPVPVVVTDNKVCKSTGLDNLTIAQELLDFAAAAVLDQCDELDGVKDGLVENPLVCDFDINALSCNATTLVNSTQCLNEAQITAFQKIYDGPRNSTGDSLYPGFSFGSENELLPQTSGSLSGSFTAAILQNLVFGNLSYDPNSFDWDTDVELVDQRAGTFIDEISPDLSAFRARGGKMIVTQGWADQYNAAVWPIQHKQQLEDAMGGNISDWFQLFMMPGMLPLLSIRPECKARLNDCRRWSLRLNNKAWRISTDPTLSREARPVA